MSSDISFGITKSARMRIASLLDEHKLRTGSSATPAILWIDPALNSAIRQGYPAIGFYGHEQEIQDDIVVVDGLRIVLAVSKADLARFEGKKLDYDGHHFSLV